MFGEKSFHALQDMGIFTTSQLLHIVDTEYKPHAFDFDTSYASDDAHVRFKRDFNAINKPAGVHGFLLRIIDPVYRRSNRLEYERRLRAKGNSTKTVDSPRVRADPVATRNPASIRALLSGYFARYSVPDDIGFSLTISIAAMLGSACAGVFVALALSCVLLFILQNECSYEKLSIIRCFWLALYPVLAHVVLEYISDSTMAGFAILCALMYAHLSPSRGVFV
jgi:hypothetical protein